MLVIYCSYFVLLMLLYLYLVRQSGALVMTLFMLRRVRNCRRYYYYYYYY